MLIDWLVVVILLVAIIRHLFAPKNPTAEEARCMALAKCLRDGSVLLNEKEAEQRNLAAIWSIMEELAMVAEVVDPPCRLADVGSR